MPIQASPTAELALAAGVKALLAHEAALQRGCAVIRCIGPLTTGSQDPRDLCVCTLLQTLKCSTCSVHCAIVVHEQLM